MKHLIMGMAIAALLTGCGLFPSMPGSGRGGKEPDLFITALWNVQALFDGEETGNEYGEYLESAGWAREKYEARVTALSQAVLQMVQPGKTESKEPAPSLIGFVELENLKVLEDLSRGALSKFGYNWAAFANLPGYSLGIGFLSRFPLQDVRAHSITVGTDTAPRPVLEVRLEPGGMPLVFLLCHWKSKLGGGDETEALRRASAKAIQRRLAELKEAEAETPVIIMGDLNENHDEFYRGSALTVRALLPDDPDAAALASQTPGGALILSGEKPPGAYFFPEGAHALYSPWERELTGGSYYYRGGWETIDHFLLSEGLFSGPGWAFAGCQVLNFKPFVTAEGVPNSYIPRYGRGLSDHLPLLLYLQAQNNLP